MSRTAVIAIGGNSLITDKEHQTVPDQYQAAAETCRHVAALFEEPGLNVVVTHGNGPQVGFILRRSELASGELHPVPLDSCVADTQGAIGYHIQLALYNEFKRRVDQCLEEMNAALAKMPGAISEAANAAATAEHNNKKLFAV